MQVMLKYGDDERLQIVQENDILAPTLHGKNSRRPLTACIAGVHSCICCLQFIDNQLDGVSVSSEAILAAGEHDLVPVPPDHAGPRLSGLTAETSALSRLSLKVLQLRFEEDRLGCVRGNQGKDVSKTETTETKKQR